MIILDQSKPISLYLKIKKSKIRKLHVCYSESNSTSFMFNKNFCEMGKKVIHQGGGAWGNGGTVQIASWKCNFSFYLHMQVYYLVIQSTTTLLGFLLVLYVLLPSIY